MNSRERVLTALNRQIPDRVPATLYEEVIGYVPGIARLLEEKCGGQAPGEYFQCDVTSVSVGPTRLKREDASTVEGLDRGRDSHRGSDSNVRIDEWGVGWRAGGYLHYEEILHPMQSLTANQIREYAFPDLDAAYRYENLAAEVAQAHQRGLAVTAFPGSIFECAWYLRGMEELFADIASDPNTAAFLLDQITKRVQWAAQRMAAADVDVLILGDDIATQKGLLMSLPMWKRVLKPRLEQVIRAAKEVKPNLLIFYHSDGNVWDAIPELIDAGVEVLNPVQPECIDPAEVKRVFGQHLAFFGSVSIQQTMPFGSPAQVRAEVKERIESVGKGGGLLIAPAHVLQPDTPWENIVAFFEAVERYGRY